MRTQHNLTSPTVRVIKNGFGGGIINYSDASTTILNNSTITLNAAQGKGGGIAAIASGSVFIIVRCMRTQLHSVEEFI